jgi:hypothetical protein
MKSATEGSQAKLFPDAAETGPAPSGTIAWRSVELPGGRVVRVLRVTDMLVLTTAWPEDPVPPVTGGVAVSLAAAGELLDAIRSLIAEHTDGTRA